MRTAHHETTRTRATLIVAATLVFVGGQLATFAHNAIVQHRVCAEHGELEHASDAEHGHASHASASEHEQTHETIGATRAGADGEAHEHCGISSMTREPMCESSPAVATAAPGQQDISIAIAPGAVGTNQALYRLAPKQSPPA